MLGAYPEKPKEPVDKLTGLPTRELFDEELAHQIEQHPGGFGVLYVDADDLKLVNDTYGHAAGDQLIVDIATNLRATVRHGANQDRRQDQDYVGRDVFRMAAKGDEFGIILAGADTQEKVDAARERLHDSLAAKGLNVSMGGRVHRAGEPAEEFLGEVDQMMYEQKAARREARKRELRASLPRHKALLFWGADKLMKMADLEYKISKDPDSKRPGNS